MNGILKFTEAVKRRSFDIIWHVNQESVNIVEVTVAH